jgi:hypothetical protein
MKIFVFNTVSEQCKTKTFAGRFKSQIVQLSVLFMVIFAPVSICAQNALELGSAIISMKASAVKSDQDRSAHLNSLANEQQPTLYINNAIISTSNNAPFVCADVDVQSINKLSETNSLFGQVELLRIRINMSDSQNILLNLENLTSFTNLKYVILLYSFNCDLGLINLIYQPKSYNGITVFYQISIPN